MWQFWVNCIRIFFIVEIITVGFLVFWLGVAALITMCVSFFIDNIFIQAVVFIIASAILILATKPFVKKFVHNNNGTKTNVFSIVGKKAMLLKI